MASTTHVTTCLQGVAAVMRRERAMATPGEQLVAEGGKPRIKQTLEFGLSRGCKVDACVSVQLESAIRYIITG